MRRKIQERSVDNYYQCLFVSICLSICLPLVYLSVYLSVHLSICLSVCLLPIGLYVCLSSQVLHEHDGTLRRQPFY